MSFTVFGATGFIGSRLVQSLRAQGIAVHVPARGETAASRIDDHVVYCIGLTADFRRHRFDAVRAHAAHLADVLENSEYESFTYLSSTRVYAGAPTGSEEETLRVSPLNPDDLYALSKLTGEALCLGIAQPSVRVVRLSNVYGDELGSPSFLAETLRRAVTRSEVTLRSSPDTERDYVHVDDVVGLLPRVARMGRERLYNIASGVNVKNRDLLRVLADETGCDVVVIGTEPSTSFPGIDIARIRAEFGFEPRQLLEELPTIVGRLGGDPATKSRLRDRSL